MSTNRLGIARHIPVADGGQQMSAEVRSGERAPGMTGKEWSCRSGSSNAHEKAMNEKARRAGTTREEANLEPEREDGGQVSREGTWTDGRRTR